jgi:hypothetical protein
VGEADGVGTPPAGPVVLPGAMPGLAVPGSVVPGLVDVAGRTLTGHELSAGARWR